MTSVALTGLEEEEASYHLIDANSVPLQEDEETISKRNSAARFHGMVIGFLAQVINISGTAFICYKWGLDKTVLSEHESISDQVAHGFVWVVSQIDLQLYVMMWMGLTAALTEPGVKYIQTHYINLSPRSVFVMGVHFYVGVVLGSFMSWYSLDFAMGLPAPVAPMLFVLMFGLLVSYSMIWCFDMDEDDTISTTKSSVHQLLVV